MRTNQARPTSFNRPMQIALIVGVVAAVIAVIGLFVSGPGVFFQAYLYSFMFWLGISLGSFAMLLVHLSVSSRWGLTIRRVCEAAGGSVWIMAILFIPLIFGLPFLYVWARPAEVAASAELQAQTWYLNVPFFIIRALIYFAIWIGLALYTNRRVALFADTSIGNQVLRSRLQGLGTTGLIIYGFTIMFASVDWLMSLQPNWISTAFGLVVGLSQVQTGIAFGVLILNLFPSLSLGRRWASSETPVPYRDLGALTMTLVMAWAYVSYFQMLIMWAGNIPREAIWYVDRLNGGWMYIAMFIGAFQFVLPFCLLLTGRVRYNLRIMALVGAMLLVTNLVNNFWHVKPTFYPGQFAISWLDIVMPFAIGGLWLAGFFYTLQRRPAMTAEDQAVLSLTQAHPEGAAPRENAAH